LRVGRGSGGERAQQDDRKTSSHASTAELPLRASGGSEHGELWGDGVGHDYDYDYVYD
jgi:hypothetical protein